jgi:signal transduction histidine kinase
MSPPPPPDRKVSPGFGLTLPVRFTLFIAGVVLATVAAYTLALLATERGHLNRQAETAQWDLTTHLANVCAEAKLNRNELPALNFMREARGSPHFLEAMCLDPSGTIWLSHDLVRLKPGAPNPGGGLGRARAVTETPLHTRWTYTVPVRRNGTDLVIGRVVFDGRGTGRSVRGLLKQTVDRALAVSLAAVGLAVLLSWMAACTLTRPILALAEGARRVGRGDWTARVPTSAPGEMGELAREFNAMSHQLGELDRLKDQFIHTVSHDLRNPLGAVATSTRLLRNEGLSTGAVPLVDIIETSVVRLEAMVSNILDTAKLREGRLTYDLRSVDLRPIVTELARLYQPVAEQARKTLTVEVPESLPPVWADEEKVRRIFLNLISNAFKFTRVNDRIVLSARPVSGGVEIKVTDTGIGIAPDRLANLFVPFHSTEGTSGESRRGQGTGLGLSIVKVLVEGQGGRLAVQTELGKGTTFEFILPVGGAEA